MKPRPAIPVATAPDSFWNGMLGPLFELVDRFAKIEPRRKTVQPVSVEVEVPEFAEKSA